MGEKSETSDRYDEATVPESVRCYGVQMYDGRYFVARLASLEPVPDRDIRNTDK